MKTLWRGREQKGRTGDGVPARGVGWKGEGTKIVIGRGRVGGKFWAM